MFGRGIIVSLLLFAFTERAVSQACSIMVMMPCLGIMAEMAPLQQELQAAVAGRNQAEFLKLMPTICGITRRGKSCLQSLPSSCDNNTQYKQLSLAMQSLTGPCGLRK